MMKCYLSCSIWKSGIYGFLLLAFTIGCDKRGDVLPNEGWGEERGQNYFS